MATATADKGKSGGNTLNQVLFYVFLIGFVLVSLFPLLWVFKMSIVTKAELFASPPTILPQNPTDSSYTTIFSDPSFQHALLEQRDNRRRDDHPLPVFRGRSSLRDSEAQVPIQGFGDDPDTRDQLLPGGGDHRAAVQRVRQIGLINTYWSVIIADTVFALPLTVWLLVAFFRELPKDLEEAAKVDGATTIQAFQKVIVPLAAPGVFTTAILTFIFAWNEFLFATTFLFDDSTQPVTVVIPNFASQYVTNYGAQAGAAVVVTIPLVIMVLIFQRRIVSGLTAGAVKG